MIFNILLRLIGSVTKKAKHVVGIYDVSNIKVKYIKGHKLLIGYP
jgi:hypothetical protein